MTKIYKQGPKTTIKSRTRTIFIGYDPREETAYQVCKSSVENSVGAEAKVYKLDHLLCRKLGVFPPLQWYYNKQGQLRNKFGIIEHEYDRVKFLTPLACKAMGREGQALYIDPTHIVTEGTDLLALFEWAEKKNEFVGVIKGYKDFARRDDLIMYNVPACQFWFESVRRRELYMLRKFPFLHRWSDRLRDEATADIPFSWSVDNTDKLAPVAKLLNFPNLTPDRRARGSKAHKQKFDNLWWDEYYSYIVDKLAKYIESR